MKGKKILALLSILMTFSALHADDGAVAAKGPSFQPFIMILIALVFFYFILWRPEQKRRKAMEQQRGAMKKGDQVTAMGIVGTVDKIKDKTIVLKMVDGSSKIEVLKQAITEVIPSESVADPKEVIVETHDNK